ncbi:MAG: IS110 family transposase [Segetibacter sp.]|nr:IS110 family transposase [Segetibacter sp.]
MNKVNQHKTDRFEKMPVVNLAAAGIDVGSRSHFVAIGQNKDDLKEFGVYTEDLHALCKHLVESGRTTVALESTGSYWQPLFVLLQQYNLNPILVNGKFTKNVKGRKTDVQDCQWIQKLHTMGMLEGSFIPDLFTEKVRQYYRHRQTLVESAASYINKMQKALRLINIRLDSVLRDVMGRSGQDIIEAILNGERNAKVLASLAQPSVKTTKEEIASALTGDWRDEYIFELRQCYDIYKYYHKKIDECDEVIKQILTAEIERKQKEENLAKAEGVKIKKKKARKNEANINIQRLAVNLTGGVDISSIEGVGLGTVLCIIAETGLELKAFPTAKHFSSWLKVAPDLKKTGGKVISSHTLKGKGRLAKALMHAANAIGNMKTGGYLVYFFKRIQRRSERSNAIIATANKLSKIIWNMLVKNQPYNPVMPAEYLDKIRKNEVKNIQRKIRQLDIREEEIQFAIA